MKKLKSRKAPPSSRCRGMVIGSFREIERATSSPAQAAMKAMVTSARAARVTTSSPAQARKNPSAACEPHWPGDTQAPSVASISATMARLVGLKTCLSRTRMRNLEPTATTAASACERQPIGAKQQAQRQRRDERALAPGDQAVGRQCVASTPGGCPFERGLRRQGAPQRHQHLSEGDIEAQANHSIAKQRPQRGDLAVACVTDQPAVRSHALRTRPPEFLAGGGRPGDGGKGRAIPGRRARPARGGSKRDPGRIALR